MKLLCMFVLFLSCNSNNNDNKVNDPGDDTRTFNASQIVGAGSTALQSSGSVFNFSALNTLNGSNCDGMISDLSSDSQGVAEYLGCLLETNSKNTETLQGSFHIVKEVISLIEAQTSFEYGSSYRTVENISGTVNVAEGDQDIVLSMKEQALGNSSWDYIIKVCILNLDGNVLNSSMTSCESNGFSFTLFLKDSDQKIGFKTVDNFFGFGGGTSFMLDVASAEMRFESWDESNNLHSRVYVKGAISTDFNLSNVSKVSFAISSEGMVDMGSGLDSIYATFDGTNLCMNSFDDNDTDQSTGGVSTNFTALGNCSPFPQYSPGFTSKAGLEDFLTNETKGLLDFDDSSFAISSYFID